MSEMSTLRLDSWVLAGCGSLNPAGSVAYSGSMKFGVSTHYYLWLPANHTCHNQRTLVSLTTALKAMR